MNTRELIYYNANTVYAINSEAFLVRNIATNDKWPPLYTMWKTGNTVYMTHGTMNSLNYVINPNGSEKKNITSDYAKDFYPYTYFPKCNITINHRNFNGNESSALKDYTEFELPINSLNNLKSSGLGVGNDLCNGIDVLMTSNLKHHIEVYIKDYSKDDGLVYSMYSYRDRDWSYTGEDQMHMKMLKYSIMPIAFALDIVTSPIQFMFIPFMVVGPGR